MLYVDWFTVLGVVDRVSSPSSTHVLASIRDTDLAECVEGSRGCSYWFRVSSVSVPVKLPSRRLYSTGASVEIISPCQPQYTVKLTLHCRSHYQHCMYRWYRDNIELHGQTTETIIISLPEQTGHYQCSLSIGPNVYFYSSDICPIRRIEKPSASMKIVSPQEPLYTGDRVTIQCNIPEYTDWTYVWYRDNQQLPSETSETITISLQDKAGQYQCHGKRTCWPSQSYPSSYLPISGIDLPIASVRVSPHGLLYSGESVTLQCDISDYTDWTYRWYRNKKLQSSGSPSKIITPLSDQVALYQCQGRRTDRPKSSQRSVSLHISVTDYQPKATLSSDKQDILTGDSVTLTSQPGQCL
ncbi:carcinoembryonic antigen-related cell adhesion molecule 5-like [Esox lucius]|uniref:carcinoembryonic antigen-related cell adhesion molecule 5-like n=1 Tax=Esox lucius TaxID=8010 RepID=UPI001477845E|nr:carcinoembryonic antigen-related cell adhesion molecule 5-like [Esox lucius]